MISYPLQGEIRIGRSLGKATERSDAWRLWKGLIRLVLVPVGATGSTEPGTRRGLTWGCSRWGCVFLAALLQLDGGRRRPPLATGKRATEQRGGPGNIVRGDRWRGIKTADRDASVFEPASGETQRFSATIQ